MSHPHSPSPRPYSSSARPDPSNPLPTSTADPPPPLPQPYPHSPKPLLPDHTPYGTRRESYGAAAGEGALMTPVPAERLGMGHPSPTAQGAAERRKFSSTAPREPQTETAKVDQLVQHFYSKTLSVISQSRMTHVLDPASDPTSASPPGSVSNVLTPGGVGPGTTSRKPSGTGVGEKGKEKGKAKTNRWFNLDLPDSPLFRDELRTWRSVSSLLSTAPSPSSSAAPFASSPTPHGPAQAFVPPLVLETILDVSDLTPNQVLVLQPSSTSSSSKRIRVDPSFATRSSDASRGISPPLPPGSQPRSASAGMRSPLSSSSAARSAAGSRRPSSASGVGGGSGGGGAPPVVLERWELRLLPLSQAPSSSSSAAALELPAVYKHSILHFRSLYTLARALPSYGLHRKLAKRRAGVGGAGLKIGVRVSTGEGEGVGGTEGEIGVEVPIEGRERGGEDEEGRGKTTEKITFPGVATPFGILSLSLTYRLNTSFSVEEIETLLSSRFIDEDFFRPTVAAQRYSSENTRPGSLPISSRIVGTGVSPARASPPAGVVPPVLAGRDAGGGRTELGGVVGMTGLAPLPSYGSLSSRHQYAPSHPHPPLPLASTSPAHVPSPLSRSPLPAPVPVAPPTGPPPSTAPSGAATPSSLSSSRFSNSAYAPPGTSAGGAVEPAFISLSRARGAAFATAGGSGIQRASPVPLSSSPNPGSVIPRRTSLTGSITGVAGSSGSPIFRPGSYFTSAAVHSSGLSSSPSYGPTGSSYGPITRQQPLPIASSTSTSSSSPASQLVFGSRSPLAPVQHSGPSMLGATAPSSGGVGVGIAIGGSSYPYPSYPSASGVGTGGGTTPSSSLGRGGVGPFAAGRGSYTSRSYGRGSSGSGGAGSGAGEWGGPESYTQSGGAGAPGLVRRASSRLSFGSAGQAQASTSQLARLAAAAQASVREEEAAGGGGGGGERKRFIKEGEAEDKDDIEAFLGMLESGTAGGGLKGSMMGSTFGGASRLGGGGGGGGAAGRSVLLSKRDVDEQMKALRSSVFGGEGSPSPPSFGLGVSPSAGTGGSLPRVGPSGLSGISSLRKQTSRLSIEEDPVGETMAAAREREKERERSPEGYPTPRAAHRPLSGIGREMVSPSLSATSSSTAIPPLPTLSTLAVESSPGALPVAPPTSRFSIEPRFLPLPHSSTTSPLASPAILRTERDLLAAFAPVSSGGGEHGQPYPPLPYPPAATTTTSCTTSPIQFTPYLSSRSRSSSLAPAAHIPRAHAVRQPLPPRLGLTTASSSGFNTPSSPSLSSAAPAGSVSSFATAASSGAGGGGGTDVETDVEAAMSSYRLDEVEAVGRLELDDSLSSFEERDRGRRFLGVVSPLDNNDGGEEALASAAAAAQAQASRDSTPAAARGVGYFGAPIRREREQGRSGGSSGSRARRVDRERERERDRERESPPEISWMG